jgi:hypothetical protein
MPPALLYWQLLLRVQARRRLQTGRFAAVSADQTVPPGKTEHRALTAPTGDEGWEFCDLQEDPEEMRNLYPGPASEAIRAELHEELRRRKTEYHLED